MDSSDGVSVWKNSTMFLAGAMLTLILAWATHSVSQDQLDRSQLEQDRRITATEMQVRQLGEQLGDIHDSQVRVESALGIDTKTTRQQRKQ